MKTKNEEYGNTITDYLITYGWAILLVLAIVGAMSYYGFISPERVCLEWGRFC